jgi:DMSO/TMAO reductase YedYZ molybdopterin-dependent catalytic subunit
MDERRFDRVGSEEGRTGPRRPLLSRRRFLLLAGAALAGLIAALGLGRGGEDGAGPVNSTGSSHGTSPTSSGSRADFPVLDVEGGPPGRLAAEDWSVALDGLVERPLRLDWAAWLALPRTQTTMSLHCVEGWSAENLHWEGVRVKDLLDRIAIRPEAGFVSFRAYGGAYANSLTLDEARAPEALLADTLEGAPLPAAHGGPLRLVVPTRLGYKNVKWVARLELAAEPHNLP